jgi:hypothetical protein
MKALPPLAATVLGVLLLVQAAFAGQPAGQTLTPPPPPYETCKAIGSGTICAGFITDSFGPADTADEGGPIVCGTGARAFDVFDAFTYDRHAARYYDANGNLTRRVKHDLITSGAFSNPLTGATVPYTQSTTTTDVLAVPGDLGSATETSTGETIFRLAHGAPLFLNVGRSVVAQDGSIVFEAGPQGFLDYLVKGDTSVDAQLCAALGAA